MSLAARQIITRYHTGTGTTNFMVSWGEAIYGATAGGFIAEGNHQSFPAVIPTCTPGSASPVWNPGFGGGGPTSVPASFYAPPKPVAKDAAAAGLPGPSAKPSGGPVTGITMVQAGSRKATIKKADGTIWAWGAGYVNGDLGLGRVFDESLMPVWSHYGFFETGVPMRLVDLEEIVAKLGTTVKKLDGLGYGMALLANGLVLVWGGFFEGELAVGCEGEEPPSPPYKHPESGKPKESEYATKKEWEEANAKYQEEARAEKQVLWEENVWRPATFPMLAQTGAPSTNPKRGVNVLEDVVEIAAGYFTTYYLRERTPETQEILFAGNPSQYALKPLYATVDPRFAKLQALVPGLGKPGGPQITQIAGSAPVLLMLLSNKKVCAIGSGLNGVNGDGKVYGEKESVGEYVNEVALPGPAVKVSVAQMHCVALLENGTVMAWGLNAQGQLGNNANLQQEPIGGTATGTPGFVIDGVAGSPTFGEALGSGAVKVVDVLARGEAQSGGTIGGDWNLALMSDGTVRAWGAGGSGQMGNLTREDSSVAIEPGRVSFPETSAGGVVTPGGFAPDLTVKNAVMIAASSPHAYVVRTGVPPELEPNPWYSLGAPGSGEIRVEWSPLAWQTGKWRETAWIVGYREIGEPKFVQHTVTPGAVGEALSWTLTGLTPGGSYEIEVAQKGPAERIGVESLALNPGVGAGVKIKLAALAAGKREEYGWEFAYQRHQEFTPLPTATEAKAWWTSVQARNLTTKLTKATGVLPVTELEVEPLAQAIPAAALLAVTSGPEELRCRTSGITAKGATIIKVTGVTPAFNFPIGANVTTVWPEPEREAWRPGRECHGRSFTFFVSPNTEVGQATFKEAELSKAFIEELEGLPNIVSVSPSGSVPKRSVRLRKEDPLTEELIDVRLRVAPNTANTVEGTWLPPLGRRVMLGVIAP